MVAEAGQVADTAGDLEDARTLNYLALAQMLYRRDAVAMNFLALSQAILPEHPPTLRLMAKVLFRLGRDKEAVQAILDLERLNAIDRSDEILELKGRALARMGLVSSGRATLAG